MNKIYVLLTTLFIKNKFDNNLITGIKDTLTDRKVEIKRSKLNEQSINNFYCRSLTPVLPSHPMKPFLLLQHRYLDEASDKEYEAVLQYGKLEPRELVRLRMEQQSISHINPLDYSGIITGGGPSNVSDNEEEKSPAQLRFEEEMNQLYHTIFEYDIPYLGMCYGMGSVTRYLGGEVSKNQFSEPVGSVRIQLEQPVTDPILKNIPSFFSAFVGHKESCQRLPEGAVLLAGSDTCPVQMIRCKQHIYATQFHPELDVPGIIVRIQSYKNHGYFNPEEAESLIDSIQNEVIKYPQKILENFIKRFRQSSC